MHIFISGLESDKSENFGYIIIILCDHCANSPCSIQNYIQGVWPPYSYKPEMIASDLAIQVINRQDVNLEQNLVIYVKQVANGSLSSFLRSCLLTVFTCCQGDTLHCLCLFIFTNLLTLDFFTQSYRALNFPNLSDEFFF